MQIAEVLSDLTSLRACDPSAALALVSARPAPPSNNNNGESKKPQTIGAKQAQPLAGAQARASAKSSSSGGGGASNKGNSEDDGDADGDGDLARAKDLVRLHYTVKVPLQEGSLDGELREARERVRRAVEGLGQ